MGLGGDTRAGGAGDGGLPPSKPTHPPHSPIHQGYRHKRAQPQGQADRHRRAQRSACARTERCEDGGRVE